MYNWNPPYKARAKAPRYAKPNMVRLMAPYEGRP